MSRYLRLMALAMTDLALTVPFGIYEVVSNAVSGVKPWTSWADTHFHFSRVDQFPAPIWRADHGAEVALELDRWIVPFCAFVFFAYFGFAEEARRNYGVAWNTIASPFKRLSRRNSSKLLDAE